MTITLPVASRRSSVEVNTNLLLNIPAVVYGPTYKSESITVDRKQFEKVFKSAGESTIIALSGLAKPVEVLVKKVAFSPIKGGIRHIDFYAIDSKSAISANVPLHFVGESPVVKSGAVLNKVLHEVTVSCLPANLPAHIDVDMSLLQAVSDVIHVSDLVLPTGVEIEQEGKEVVLMAELIAEEVDAAPANVDMAAVEVEAKGKAEVAAE